MKLRILFSSVILLLFQTLLVAGSYNAKLLIQNDKVFLGDETTITLIIPTENKINSLPKINLNGVECKLVLGILEEADGIKNFVVKYNLKPLKAGEINISPLKVFDGKKSFISNPIKISVIKPAETPKLKLFTEFPDKEVYLNQPFRVKFIWRSEIPFKDIKAVDLFMTSLSSKSFKSYTVEPKIKEELKVGLTVNKTRVITTYSSKIEDDNIYYYLTFERIMIPQEVGELDVASGRLVCSVPKHKKRSFGNSIRQYPSYFNNNLFATAISAENYYRYYVKSEQKKIKVIPLPVNGMPENFSKIVGKFNISLTASPLKVSVGTPITLKFTISDYPFLEGIELPDLTSNSELAQNFYIYKEHSPAKYSNKGKIFYRSIRLLNPSVSHIPAITFNYFDPTTKKYVLIKTQPIELEVVSNGVVSMNDIKSSIDIEIKNKIKTNNSGLWDIYYNIPDRTFFFNSPLLHYRYVLLCFILPLLLLLFKKNADDIDSLIKRYKKVFYLYILRRKILSSNELTVIYDLLKKYYSVKNNIKLSTITFFDIEQEMIKNDISQEVYNELKEAYHKLDSKNYNDKELSCSVEVSTIKKSLRKILKSLSICLIILSASEVNAFWQCDRLRFKAVNLEKRSLELQKEYENASKIYQLEPNKGKLIFDKLGNSYLKTAGIFEKGNIISAGKLYYNAGNSFYNAGNIGMAIYSYLKAERCIPFDDQVKDNLNFVRSQRYDEFTPSVFSVLYQELLAIINYVPLRQCYILFYLSILLLLILILKHDESKKLRTLFYITIAVSIATFSIISLNEYFVNINKRGVIVVDNTITKKGAGYAFETAFNETLHSGTEFNLIEFVGDWVHIRFVNGEHCWVKVDCVKFL